MPRNRDRTTTKASWTVKTLEDAIITLKRGGTSVYKVSQGTGIPYSTLKKRYNLAKANDDRYKSSPKLGRHTVFTPDQEKVLADHLRAMSNKFYGLTREQFRKTCFLIAEKMGVAERFNTEAKIAGKDWLSGFLQRHPDLSIRKPEATSINRILGFNKNEVTRFFDNLETLMQKYNFGADMVYNMDETGITTVQETEKIIAPKGQKRVGSVTSWERGKNVTVICAMSASGCFIPPLFIFPRKRHSPQLERDGPPGAVYTCSDNGWTNESIFITWLNHFIKQVEPTAEKPVLLVMDNHNSHSTLEAWELAKKNNVIMLTIPPHTSHRLQPLDVTFYSPLKKAYNKECDMYMKSKNLTKISHYEIAGLLNKAYMRVANIEKGVSGFRVTGIFPMRPSVFCDEDFIDEEVNFVGTVDQSILHDTTQQPATEILPDEASVNPNRIRSPIPSTSFATPQKQLIQQPALVSPCLISSQSYAMPKEPTIQEPVTITPSSSNHNRQPSETNIDKDQTVTTDFACAVSTVSPLPQPHISNKNKILKNKQHSEILTSTPMKAVFEEKKKKRIEKESKAKLVKKNLRNCDKENCAKGKCNKKKCAKDKRVKRRQTTTKSQRVKKAKINLYKSDDEETSVEDLDENLICDDESEYSEEETLCAICSDTGKSGEMWYRCRSCGSWAHKECSGSDHAASYICAFCLEP